MEVKLITTVVILSILLIINYSEIYFIQAADS